MMAVLRALRHPLRWVLSLVATVVLVGSVAGGAPLLAAAFGTALGQPSGELLGRSRLRLPVAIVLLASALGFGWGLGWLFSGSSLGPSLLGPGWAIIASDLTRVGATTFTLWAGLRLFAIRLPAFLAVETGAMGLTFALGFVAHRDGAVARPLWLSDPVWRAGFDPADALLALGALFGLGLLAILALEARRRPALSAAFLVPALTLTLLALIDASGLQKPPPPAELAEIRDAMGDPPLPTPPEGQSGGGESPTEEPDEGGGGQGEEPEEGEGGGGGQGEEPQGAEEGGEQPQGGQQPQDGEQPQGGGAGEPKEGEEPQEGSEGEGEGAAPPPPPQPDDLDKPSSSKSQPQPVAIILLGDDYSPPSELFYLRQEAHSEFTGTRLGPTSRPDVDLDVITEFPNAKLTAKAPPAEDGRAVVHATVALLAEHDRAFGLETVLTFSPVVNPNPARFVAAYNVRSAAVNTPYEDLLSKPVGDPTWTEEQLAYYTQVPEDPRYGTLAQEIIAGLPPDAQALPFAKALAVKLWLDRSMKYTTKEKHHNVPDPTADFLFGNLTGYCVHSAHASVFLWRSLGIPARVSTGYAVQASELQGASLVVMSNNAHAWPELYIEGLGWVPLDVAPEQVLDEPGEPVDEEMVELLSEMAREKPDPELAERREPIDWAGVGRFVLRLGLSTLGAALLFALAAAYTTKLWRRLAPRLASARALPRVGYRLALDLLAEAGLSRREGETREAFARRVAESAPTFAQITTLHLDVAMGDPAASPWRAQGHGPWGEALTSLRAELGASVRLRRRLLGLVNPFSLFMAR
ncbi:MAG: hypothetical protein RIT28_233 [Pseudomonadota bacterium]